MSDTTTPPSFGVPRRRGRPPNITPQTPAESVRQAAAPAELGEFAPRPEASPKSTSTLSLEDPRTRAARRAFELREHLGTMDQGTDEYAIDPRIIPDGWSYEWKAREVLGKEQVSYMVGIQQRGWEAVPTSRHPEMMPRGHDLSAAIERKGQVLMERPLEITQEAQQIERNKARAQMNQKEQQLNVAPPGQFERNNKGERLNSIKREYGYEPIAIPK
jgi:hypothetical protein